VEGSKAVAVVYRTANVHITKRVSRSAAELAYFLMLSLFPTLICLNALLGRFLPDSEETLAFIESIVPAEAVRVISDYLGYVARSNNRAMFTAGLILMATSSSAAFRSINSAMGDIHGSSRYSGGLALVMSFLFSVVFLVTIYFAAAVVVSGNWFLGFLERHAGLVNTSGIWMWLRFPLLFVILVVIVYGLYRLTAPRDSGIDHFPGAVTASAVLAVVSIVFSLFIGMSARYPLVYGSLASIIIMMVWLYTCGNIILLGNVFNVVCDELGDE
jgi:YihY family inner membrane protein